RLVRILKDQVQTSPQGPHLDAEQALRLSTPGEDDFRRGSRCDGGDDHAQEHRKRRRSPDRRPDSRRVERGARQRRGPSQCSHDREQVEGQDREECQHSRCAGGRPRRRQRPDDSQQEAAQEARPEDEAGIHEGPGNPRGGERGEAHGEDERRGDGPQPEEDLLGVPRELFRPRERVLLSDRIDPSRRDGRTSGTPGYRKHAARRPGVTSASAGSAAVHRSNANLHRGWKTQPDGGLIRLGTSPGMEAGIVRWPRISGKAATSPWVYGCFGSVNTSTVFPTSIILPPYMIATFSHVSAMTLRSWEIRIIDRWSSFR